MNIRLIFLCFLLKLAACKQEMPAAETAISKRASWKNAGCELITDQEVAQVFNFDRLPQHPQRPVIARSGFLPPHLAKTRLEGTREQQ